MIVWSGLGLAAAEQTPTQQPAALPTAPTAANVSLWGADAFFDAGSQGCGDGALEKTASLMRRLHADQTLEIYATDPSVAVDLAAWCRMTGHQLVEQTRDRYLLRHA